MWQLICQFGGDETPREADHEAARVHQGQLIGVEVAGADNSEPGVYRLELTDDANRERR